MRICYKFASRERPGKFFKCLDNISSLAKHDDYFILASLDLDDKSMANPEVRDRIKQYPKVVAYYGTSQSKIHAINRDMEFSGDWDILCNHSDDMVFIKEGYDLDILDAFNGFDGLVHFPDQKVGAKLITYAMMSRGYYDLDGHIYYPRFKSVYADNYQQWLAQKRKQYKYVPLRILDHEHSIWGYGPPDELLKRTEDPVNYERDRKIFIELTS